MSGDGFQQKPLTGYSEDLDEAENRYFCNPLEIRASAIILLRLYEEAIYDSDIRLADQRLKSLRSSVDLALKCVPTEGFLWFVRYWSAVSQGSPASEHFEELRMSYRLAPFEGWIVLRRSPYVLAIYDTLPPDLKEMAANEFLAMVSSGYIKDAVRILRDSAWNSRDELMPRLLSAPLDRRIDFDHALRGEGLSVVIPGVPLKEFRPWRY